jgi:hypothetical protein
MAFFDPNDFRPSGGWLPFEDRWNEEPIQAGTFAAPGDSRFAGMPEGMVNARMFPGYGTNMPSGGGEAAGGPQMPAGEPQMAPQGMPPQGYAPPSAPIVMPSLGGMAPTNRPPDIGDRLQAAGAGFFNAGSPMQAIGNLLGGLFTGQRQDPAGIRAQMFGQAQAASQQQTMQSAAAALEYVRQDPSIPQPMKLAMLRQPALAMKYVAELAKPLKPEFSAEKIENSGYTFDKNTGKWTLGVTAPQKPENPPAGYEWVSPGNPSAGLKPIAGGPATKLEGNTAGYLAMMESSAPGVEKAKQYFLSEDFKSGPIDAAGKVIGQATNSFEIARHRRSIEMATEAALRIATGAAAPADEVKRYANFYMPSVYDSEETRRQKLNALTGFMDYAKKNIGQGRVPQPDFFMAGGGGKKSNDPLGIR